MIEVTDVKDRATEKDVISVSPNYLIGNCTLSLGSHPQTYRGRTTKTSF